MKIALIQQEASADKSANIEKGMKAAAEAAENGAEVICFAELAFENFYPQYRSVKDKLSLAETVPGFITEQFSKIASDFGVVIILNHFERDGEKTFDSSPVIGTKGELLGVTRMIHITDYEFFHEKEYYHPGDENIKIYETPFGKFGISVCYDRHYPEYMRALALKGAEVVFIPQAGAVGEWPEGLYEAEMRVASFQNGYFTALCNRVGKEEKLEFSGESFICDPEGNVVARAGKGTEEILYYDADISCIEKSHARRLFMRDRRPEIYYDWFGKTE